MTTFNCAFSWGPELASPGTRKQSLTTTVALVLHVWGKGGKTRLSNTVSDGQIPMKATVTFDAGRDPSAWQDLVEIARKEKIQCDQVKEPRPRA